MRKCALVLAIAVAPVPALAVSAETLDAEATAANAVLSPEASGVDGANTAPTTMSDPDIAAPVGNPLWKVPLSALNATRDRPLFSASRLPAAAAAVAPPQETSPAPPPEPSSPQRPELSLMGTIVGSNSSVALLRAAGSQELLRLHLGQENSGWRVEAIDRNSVVVAKGGQSVRLDLPKPDIRLQPQTPNSDDEGRK